MNLAVEFRSDVRFRRFIASYGRKYVRGSENALQGKYDGYRGIFGISSRRKIDGRDFFVGYL